MVGGVSLCEAPGRAGWRSRASRMRATRSRGAAAGTSFSLRSRAVCPLTPAGPRRTRPVPRPSSWRRRPSFREELAIVAAVGQRRRRLSARRPWHFRARSLRVPASTAGVRARSLRRVKRHGGSVPTPPCTRTRPSGATCPVAGAAAGADLPVAVRRVERRRRGDLLRLRGRSRDCPLLGDVPPASAAPRRRRAASSSEVARRREGEGEQARPPASPPLARARRGDRRRRARR